jgi:polysaccharide deacetylase family protein (PEP-CTERM system associated)
MVSASQQNITANALSIDVEDYFQVWALSEKISRDDWDAFSLRVETSTRRALDLFGKHNATATFFTLAWVAQKCPQLMKDIVSAGHEIGSHGMEHVKVFDQTAGEFRQDAGDAKKILEDITGTEVKGYRAAGFSIDERTPWAFQVLAELGYHYSSSVHPIDHDHYGMPDAPRFAYHPLEGHSFTELPVSTVDAYGKRLSCAGGGWFRALPYRWSKHLIDRLLQEQAGPAVFYFHPWEIDPGQPRVEGLSAKSRFRHYLNLDKMEHKLGRLLSDYRWARLDEVLGLTAEEQAA